LVRTSELAIWKRWRPQDAGRRRATTAVALNLLPATVAGAAFVLLTPTWSWQRPVFVVALGAIGAVAFLSEIRLKVAAPAYFDASIVLALLALAVAGPMAGLLVWAVPELIARLTVRRDPVITPGLVATLTSFALAVLAGDAVLRMADAPSTTAQAPALYTAGIAMYVFNFAFARLAFAPWYQGFSPGGLVRSEFLGQFPALLIMLLLAAITAASEPALGVLALAPLAVVVVTPQLVFAAMARARSVKRLRPWQATSLYAAAIADAMGLSRFERRVLGGAGTLLASWEGAPEPAEASSREALPPLSGLVALCVDERWDGEGRPFGIPASQTPVASRVLAVARAWSGLTARDTPEFSHEEAMLDLAARAGSELDPQVVETAARVVAEEGSFVREPDFQPRLHRLPLPRPVRRVGLPALAARLGA